MGSHLGGPQKIIQRCFMAFKMGLQQWFWHTKLTRVAPNAPDTSGQNLVNQVRNMTNFLPLCLSFTYHGLEDDNPHIANWEEHLICPWCMNYIPQIVCFESESVQFGRLPKWSWSNFHFAASFSFCYFFTYDSMILYMTYMYSIFIYTVYYKCIYIILSLYIYIYYHYIYKSV